MKKLILLTSSIALLAVAGGVISHAHSSSNGAPLCTNQVYKPAFTCTLSTAGANGEGKNMGASFYASSYKPICTVLQGQGATASGSSDFKTVSPGDTIPYVVPTSGFGAGIGQIQLLGNSGNLTIRCQ